MVELESKLKLEAPYIGMRSGNGATVGENVTLFAVSGEVACKFEFEVDCLAEIGLGKGRPLLGWVWRSSQYSLSLPLPPQL